MWCYCGRVYPRSKSVSNFKTCFKTHGQKTMARISLNLFVLTFASNILIINQIILIRPENTPALVFLLHILQYC